MKKKLLKGMVQDALRGLSAPELAGVFEATGQQSLAPATLGEALVRGITPTNGLPGVTASLQGGQTPYVVAAEAGGGLDLTKAMKKALKKRLKAALKNANNGGDLSAEDMALIVGAGRAANDIQVVGGVQPRYVNKQVKKAAKDPIALLARVDALAAKLSVKQRTNPYAVAALTTAARNRRRAELVAGQTASVAKGMESISAPEVLAAIDDLERVLGLTASAKGFSPTQIAADQQLRQIVGGGTSESLRGTQAAGSLVGGPAAMLGLALKSGLGEEIAQAEQVVAKARATGRGVQQAEGDLTALRLKAEALSTFGPVGPFGGR